MSEPKRKTSAVPDMGSARWVLSIPDGPLAAGGAYELLQPSTHPALRTGGPYRRRQSAAAEWFLDVAGNITEPQVTVTRTVDTVTVEVTGRAPRLLPGFDWEVTARAVAPVERFIPEPDR